MSVQEVFELGMRGVFFFIPAYIANASALIFKGGKQMDFGKVFIDGKPIFGSGKTFRGFSLGIIVGTLAGVLIGIPVTLSFLISLGALTGDLAGAFVKRRLSMRPGDPAPVLDQFDFILGATLLSQSWIHLDLRSIVIVMALTPLIHLVSNSLAFLLKIKKVPW
ncbi:MAG: CDP-2,3-bis-(O-geranylgeranyl)-sn-glycerol synthase [Crenarchaeota archaeon]|nr:CDP-2,3-bis-(O-geranylgeranyl)-sn-glycerol synthase [Thermoproteota archaeon]MDW8034245.1 CDP-2,3-bis-(O-geranylgeranyl)-sn-glycerol synthase [Nitrososphaerota archaeon]